MAIAASLKKLTDWMRPHGRGAAASLAHHHPLDPNALLAEVLHGGDDDFCKLDLQCLALLKRQGWNPQTIFDVGASDGAWSKFIVPLFPEARYELFEPGVDAYERYGRGMQRRLKAHPNFHLHKTALGSAPGKITLHADEHFVGGTTLAIDPAIPGFTRYEVPVTTIDDVVARGQAPIPNLVKIDVQGGELDILKGAEQTLPHVEVLHLELWLTRGYGPKTPLLVEVALWLRERGFDLRDFADCYRNPEGVRCTQDCVFVNRRSPLSLVKD